MIPQMERILAAYLQVGDIVFNEYGREYTVISTEPDLLARRGAMVRQFHADEVVTIVARRP